MDHVVIPLDGDHARAAAQLAGGITAAAGMERDPESTPHITLVAFSGGQTGAVLDVLRAVAAATEPFTTRAHGFGFFSGDEPSDLSLHVPVVRGPALDALHRDVCAAVQDVGGQVAGWCTPDLWTPHVTLVDRDLDPVRLGRGATWLSRRHHPSWHIPVDRLCLTGGWPERAVSAEMLALGSAPEVGLRR